MPGERSIPGNEGQPEGPFVLPQLPDAGDIYQPIQRERFAQIVGACTEAKSIGLQLLILRQINNQRTQWVDLSAAFESAQNFDGNADSATGEVGYLPGKTMGHYFFRSLIAAGVVELSNEQYRVVDTPPGEISRLFALTGAMQEISDMFEPYGISDVCGNIKSANVRLAVIRAIDDEYSHVDQEVKEVSFPKIGRTTAQYLGINFNSQDEWETFLHSIYLHLAALKASEVVDIRASETYTGPSYRLTTQDVSQIPIERIGRGTTGITEKTAREICEVLARNTGRFLYATEVCGELRKLPGERGEYYKDNTASNTYILRIGRYLSLLSKNQDGHMVRREDKGIYFSSHRQMNSLHRMRLMLDALQNGSVTAIQKYCTIALQNATDTTHRQQRHYMQKGQERNKERSEEERKKEREQIIGFILKKGGISIQEIVTELQTLAKDRIIGLSIHSVSKVIMGLRKSGRIIAIKRPNEQFLRFVFNFNNQENQDMLGEAEPDVLRNTITVEDPPPGDVVVDSPSLLPPIPEEELLEGEHVDEDTIEETSVTRRGRELSPDEQETQTRNLGILARLINLRQSIGPDEENWEDWQRANYVTQRAEIITQLAENNRASIASALARHFRVHSIRSGEYRQDAETIASFESVVAAAESVIKQPLGSVVFGAYLHIAIQRRLQKWHQDIHSGLVRLPHEVRINYSNIWTAIEHLTEEMERAHRNPSEPRVADIVEALKTLNLKNTDGKTFTEELVRHTIEAMREFSQDRMRSLDASTTEDGATLEEIVAGEGPIEMPTSENDLLAYIRGAFQRSYRVKNGKDINQGKKSMEQVMEEASRDAEIIFLRVIEEKKSGELAERYGIDPDKMYRIINEGLNILRDDPQLVAMLTG